MSEASLIFVLDDDASVRDSLRRLFLSLGYSVEVFANAQALFDHRQLNAATCLVLDMHLPDIDGLEVQRRLCALGWQVPIVFLTGRGDIPMSVKAIKAGAVEFLTKPFRQEELVEAVRAALDVERGARVERSNVAELCRRYESLTPRERAVMAGVVSGLLNKQIAADFGTSEATVKEQRAQAMVKMKAGSLAELVQFATRLGDRFARGATRP